MDGILLIHEHCPAYQWGPGFLQDVIDGKKTFEDPSFTDAVEKFEQCRFPSLS